MNSSAHLSHDDDAKRELEGHSIAPPPSTDPPTKRIPDDMLEDPKGRWIMKSMIKPIDLQSDALVRELVKRAHELQELMAAFKLRAMADVRAHLDLIAQEYGTRIEGEKGNVSLSSYDGALRVQIAVADRIAFNERLHIAKKLVDECIARWAKDSDDKIRLLVSDAFQLDKKGAINTERVLALRKLNIDDDVWKQAMKAIDDSIITESTVTYIRFHERAKDGKYRAIELDLSKVA